MFLAECLSEIDANQWHVQIFTLLIFACDNNIKMLPEVRNDLLSNGCNQFAEFGLKAIHMLGKHTVV